MDNKKWKYIDGYKGLYKISDKGDVYSLRSKRNLSEIDNQNGYKFVYLYKDGEREHVYIHRLVALAFIENSEQKRTVNHKDGNKSNNSVENLEWATYSENVGHAFKNGFSKISDWQKQKISKASRGSKNSASKLTEKDIPEIFKMSDSGLSQREIAEKLGVSRPAIGYVLRGKTWTHVSTER